LSLVQHDLHRTVAARWRAELAGRTHGSTKAGYYRAVAALLAAGADAAELGWTDVVAAVEPHGSRTTFFGVAGPHAKKPLVGAYRAEPPGPVRDVAACVSRATAPEMLVDETKVWSYWPHRDGWTDELLRGAGTAAAECLIRVLLDWASREPELAAALDHSPPASAIEDLVVLRSGRMAAGEAARVLREAIRLRLAGGCSADGVVHLLRRELRPASAPGDGIRPLARAIDQLTRNSRAPSEERRHAVAMMRDAIALLEAAPE
jgi:hypothetical protein